MNNKQLSEVLTATLEKLTARKYENLPLANLIRIMENAPDFGYDDAEAEMKIRGIKYKWTDNNKISIL